jgi:hypothetical protein
VFSQHCDINYPRLQAFFLAASFSVTTPAGIFPALQFQYPPPEFFGRFSLSHHLLRHFPGAVVSFSSAGIFPTL